MCQLFSLSWVDALYRWLILGPLYHPHLYTYLNSVGHLIPGIRLIVKILRTFLFRLSTAEAQRIRHQLTPADMSYGKAENYRPVPRDFNTLIQTCSSNIQKITQNSKCIPAASVCAVGARMCPYEVTHSV